MQTQITGHNMEVTPTLRKIVEKKLARLLNHHADLITNIHIKLSINKLSQDAEGQIAIPGNSIHASAQSEDMYKTIDLLMDKLTRQLNKHKEKQSERR